jgi:hypothetical protein
MDRVEVKQALETRCSQCGKLVPNYEIVNYGSIETANRELCIECFNGEVAKEGGLDKFEHLHFEPIQLVDCAGRPHDFHFQTHLFGPGVALDAFEVCAGQPSGYQFQIIGEPEEDLLTLLSRLIGKMRRALSVNHVQDGEYGLQIADRVVRGRITWDQAPLLVIDGREIAWDEFGRMMMCFEGGQFRLEIRDKSEEL